MRPIHLIKNHCNNSMRHINVPLSILRRQESSLDRFYAMSHFLMRGLDLLTTEILYRFFQHLSWSLHTKKIKLLTFSYHCHQHNVHDGGSTYSPCLVLFPWHALSNCGKQGLCHIIVNNPCICNMKVHDHSHFFLVWILMIILPWSIALVGLCKFFGLLWSSFCLHQLIYIHHCKLQHDYSIHKTLGV